MLLVSFRSSSVSLARSSRRDCCFTPLGVTAAWWPLRCKFGSAGAGAESPLSRLELARSRLALGASGCLDSAAYPDSGQSAEMRACGDERDALCGVA